jgi:hypothetical protein
LQELESQWFPAGLPQEVQLYSALPQHLPRLVPQPGKQELVLRAARFLSCAFTGTAEILALA